MRQIKNLWLIFGRRQIIIKQFVKFCLVGTSNLIIDISVYWVLTRTFHIYYLLAAVFSFVIAVSWSFYFNRRWTFRHQGQDLGNQYFKFFIANVLALILNLSMFYLLVEYINFYDLLAKLIIAFIVAFFNFSLNRFWTFRISSPLVF